MRLLVVIGLGWLTSLSAWAEHHNPGEELPSIEITRFWYVNKVEQRSPTAEMCGRVSTVNFHDRIVVITDPDRRAESRYVTVPDENGKWCVIVKTLSGEGRAGIWRFSHENSNAPAGKKIATVSAMAEHK